MNAQIERKRNSYHKTKRWQRLIAFMAALLILFTTPNALTANAANREAETSCGYEEHIHNDSCYTEQKTLVCELSEEGHVHGDSCYAKQEDLVCGLEENEEHNHSEDCYKVLVCEQEGTSPHEHTDECYVITRELSCEKEEHTHSLQCYSDPNADMESAETWAVYARSSGNTEADVLAVAKSQIGYRESEKNYLVLNETDKQGYTRYGAFLGNPYGEWNGYFVLFCLNYANVPAGAIPSLNSAEPQPGYIAHLDMNGDGAADSYGIISEAREDTLRIIEGDHENAVAEVKYSVPDSRIMGYTAFSVLDNGTEKQTAEEKTNTLNQPDEVLDGEQPAADGTEDITESEPRTEGSLSKEAQEALAKLYDELNPTRGGAKAAGEWTLNNTEAWTGGSATTVIDGRTLTITPATNDNKTSVYYYLQYSFSGDEDIEPGKIEIRVPQHIFYDRSGNPTGTFGIAVPAAPELGPDGYHYTVDEETDEIVITNHATIKPGSTFRCGVEYFFTPVRVANGYEKDFTVHYEINTPDGLLEKDSEPLTIKVETDFMYPAVYKYGPSSPLNSQKYEAWQSDWGTAPADAADYFYISWYISMYPSGGNLTQPFTMHMEETPGEGEIVAWSLKRSGVPQWTLGNLDTLNQTIFYTHGENASGNPQSVNVNVNLVMRYPRELAVDGREITNTVTAVTEGMDGGRRTATATATYPYQAPEDFTYPGDIWDYSKNPGKAQLVGGRLLLEAGDLNIDWDMYVSHRCWEITEKGTVPCYSVIQDNMLDVLNPEDYEYASFKMGAWSEKTLYVTPNGARISNSAVSNYGTIEVFVRTRGSENWFKYGEVNKTSTSSTAGFKFTDYQGKITNNANTVPLPEGTIEVQFRHEGTAYEVVFRVSLNMTLHPTEHVFAYLDETGDKLTNTASFAAAPDGTGEFHESDDYGGFTGTDDASVVFTEPSAKSSHSKRASSGTNDVEAKQYRVTYTLSGVEYCDDAPSQEIAHSVLHEQRNVIFYDLLPQGGALNPASLQVSTSGSNIPCDYRLETVDDWRGSGRTMVIIHASVPDEIEYNDYYVTGGRWNSGLIASFQVIFDWELLGPDRTKTNTFAYFSPDGPLVGGYADNGQGLTGSGKPDIPYYVDLDGDGNPAPGYRNVWYGQVNIELPNITASENGLVKRVKSDEEPAYLKDASPVAAGGGYSYRIGYNAPTDSKAKDIIIYDVLENAAGTDPYWRGTLQSVDVSRLILAGIDARVYYSTRAELRTQGLAAYQDLSDTSVWTTTMPADKMLITAIAVDMRNSLNGGEYVFEPETGAFFYVHMRAPENVAELAENDVKAYNNAWIHSSLITPYGDLPATLEYGSTTTIGLRIPQPEIHKESDPVTGTQELPTYVPAGDPIEYHLTIKNTEILTTIYQIVVEDTIPEGLDIDLANIRCYFNSQSNSAVLVSESPRVSVVPDGQHLRFTIDKLDGNETVHLLIPTLSDDAPPKDRVYENTAYITRVGGNDVEIQSETTWHKPGGKLSFSKLVTQNGTYDLSNTFFTVYVTLTDPLGEHTGRSVAVTQKGRYSSNPSTVKIGTQATFRIYEGETIVIGELPYGIEYQVTETSSSAYRIVYENDLGEASNTGVVDEDRPNPHVDIHNYYGTGGELAFTKTVAGDGDPEEYFKVTVQLRPTEGVTASTYKTITIREHGSYAGNPSSFRYSYKNGATLTFYIKHGETIRIPDLPIGVGWLIEEADYSSEGYVTSYWSEDTGEVANSGQLLGDSVLVPIHNNIPLVGDLSVTKTVDGNAPIADKEFNFTVTLSDTSITGTYGDMTFTDGVATFTLKGGESKTAVGLPAGTGYTVTEEDYAADGYVTTKTGDTGTIVGNEEQTAAFTNTRDTYGDLIVTKTVAGNAPIADKAFRFTVTLSDTSITGDYGEMSFENGVATFTLKDGESKKATGLPNGVTYEVTEEDYTTDGYVTTKTGDTGTIVGNEEQTAAFTNTRDTYGDLIVTKTVAGNAPIANKAFRFTVTLSDTSITGDYGEMNFENGVATFILKNGESKTATGLPNGIGYEVTEEDYTIDGYVTTATGETGTIVGGEKQTAAFTNTRNAEGSLTVSKKLAGNDMDSTKEFTFTITLSDTTINGTYSGVKFTDGVATITLKGGESKTIEGLPNGIGYEVTEEDYTTDGYETTSTGNIGTIDENTPVVAAFTNTRDTYGDLIVTKTVKGNAASTTKEFSFTVTLSDTTINGTYGDMTFTDGVATFTLKGGESKTATDLPNGITYEVTEADYSADGYVTIKTGDTGTIAGGETVEAAFTNTKNPPPPPDDPKTGDLKVSKTVAGEGADQNKEFSFTVTLSDTTINGTYGDMTFTNGVATFTLTGGENKTATGLPAGITYVVTEADYSADGYVTTKIGDTGKIVANTTATAAFMNTKTPPPPDNPEYGSLTVKKTVTGDLADKDQYFTFTITFDAPGSYSYTGSKSGTIKSGDTVELKHGESITISGLPAGTTYVVTESGNNGYRVYASGDKGTIAANATSTAAFTNARSSVPQTGDDSNLLLWLSMAGISGLGMLLTGIFRRKRKGKHSPAR